MHRTKKLVLIGGVALLPATWVAAAQSVTPPTGVVGSPLVRGSFTDDTGVAFTVKYADSHRTLVARARDASDVATNGFTFEPGGSTGWHSHPGPVVVVIKTGALTYYQVSARGRCVGPVSGRFRLRRAGRRPRSHGPQREWRDRGDVCRLLRRPGGRVSPDG